MLVLFSFTACSVTGDIKACVCPVALHLIVCIYVHLQMYEYCVRYTDILTVFFCNLLLLPLRVPGRLVD